MLLNDHVAEVDPRAKRDPALFRHVGLSIYHRTLDLNSAAHGIDDARELGKKAIAGVLDDAAPVLGDLRINQLAEMRPQAFVRTLLVGSHQPRIPRHVCGEDRG
jgi:hypothetical protein